ncbi:MAG: shikimate dehydrogenase [Chitinophagaceae bacterium]|nr:shikimate dehydrogenase [Chitinophagaceae bacterium]
MKQFGLIGYPLSHSFSKNYFTKKFQDEGIANCRYELFPIKTITELNILLQQENELQGLNVTIPYKETVLPFLQHVSPAVAEIGACNCIRIKDGQLEGFNTDVIGFEQTLQPLLMPQHTKALILGTGGAAKAVAWVLKQKGIHYQYVSRTQGEGRMTYEELNANVLSSYTIIINTTPLGMQPNIHQKPSLPYTLLTQQHLCYDLIYNPSKTNFLLEAEKQGAVIKNGEDMLIIQAEESWKIWNAQ